MSNVFFENFYIHNNGVFIISFSDNKIGRSDRIKGMLT